MAIVLDQEAADTCVRTIADAEQLLMSAGTLTQCVIVSAARDVGREMEQLLDQLSLTIVPLTAERARAAGEAYRQWGKGFHAAKLNYGDSFAYALAKEQGCPLLYVGNDFAQTDVLSTFD